MNPPSNITLCSLCGRVGCPGHPVVGTLILLTFVAIPAVLAYLLLTRL
mgnify:CR=1 FL=1